MTNYFSINFQVNIMSLRRNFFVYLHFTSLFTLWREHELRKRQSKFLQNINTLQVKNFALKVLCELFFLILYFFSFLFHAILPKFPNIVVHVAIYFESSNQ